MQAEVVISFDRLTLIADAIYEIGNPKVQEAYSVPEEDLRRLDTATALLSHIEKALSGRLKSASYMIYYPESEGITKQKRIDLIPEKCDGKKFRFFAEGWGLIQFQLRFSPSGDLMCRFAVNSEKRAKAWFPTFPDHGDPSLWKWKIVERHARRLIRSIKPRSRTSGYRQCGLLYP
jgi:hypothetical protein